MAKQKMTIEQKEVLQKLFDASQKIYGGMEDARDYVLELKEAFGEEYDELDSYLQELDGLASDIEAEVIKKLNALGIDPINLGGGFKPIK